MIMRPAHVCRHHQRAGHPYRRSRGRGAVAAHDGGMRKQDFCAVGTAHNTQIPRTGSQPKHCTPMPTEIQYILEGKGTLLVSEKEAAVLKQERLGTHPEGLPRRAATSTTGSTNYKALATRRHRRRRDDTKMLKLTV